MEKISKSRKSKMKKTPDDVEAMKLEIAEESWDFWIRFAKWGGPALAPKKPVVWEAC